MATRRCPSTDNPQPAHATGGCPRSSSGVLKVCLLPKNLCKPKWNFKSHQGIFVSQVSWKPTIHTPILLGTIQRLPITRLQLGGRSHLIKSHRSPLWGRHWLRAARAFSEVGRAGTEDWDTLRASGPWAHGGYFVYWEELPTAKSSSHLTQPQELPQMSPLFRLCQVLALSPAWSEFYPHRQILWQLTHTVLHRHLSFHLCGDQGQRMEEKPLQSSNGRRSTEGTR